MVVWRRKVPFTDKQLIALYEKGLKDREIAEELGAHRSVVKYQRRRLGLKAHDRRLFTDQQLIDLHEEGLNDREKAERLGVSEGAVFYHRKRLGLEANRYRTLDRPFTNQQLIALHEKGLNDREIAKELHVHHGTVGNRRRKLGLEPNYRLLFTDQQLIDLHEEGLSDREKAERLGVSESAVFNHRKRLGLKPAYATTLDKGKKTRVSVILSNLHLEAIDHLVEEGLYLNPGEIFREALRRIFRAHKIEPFYREPREIEGKTEKVPEDRSREED